MFQLSRISCFCPDSWRIINGSLMDRIALFEQNTETLIRVRLFSKSSEGRLNIMAFIY